MDYFTDLLATFLDADRVNYIAVYGRAREHQKYLKLCSEDEQNKAFTALERHGGKWLMIIFILGWSNPLKNPFFCIIGILGDRRNKAFQNFKSIKPITLQNDSLFWTPRACQTSMKTPFRNKLHISI